MRNQPVQFLWDANKAEHNRKKHKVTFDEAVTVFDDPHARVIYDLDHSKDEHREIIIGYSNENHLLFVSFQEREPDVIRLISARKANRQERRQYEEKDK